jgi:hypothetical protein
MTCEVEHTRIAWNKAFTTAWNTEAFVKAQEVANKAHAAIVGIRNGTAGFSFQSADVSFTCTPDCSICLLSTDKARVAEERPIIPRILCTFAIHH